MAKQKTITLSGPFRNREDNEAWKVERITNSMQWHVGAFLPRHEVQELCTSKNWNVIFKPVKGV